MQLKKITSRLYIFFLNPKSLPSPEQATDIDVFLQRSTSHCMKLTPHLVRPSLTLNQVKM